MAWLPESWELECELSSTCSYNLSALLRDVASLLLCVPALNCSTFSPAALPRHEQPPPHTTFASPSWWYAPPTIGSLAPERCDNLVTKHKHVHRKREGVTTVAHCPGGFRRPD